MRDRVPRVPSVLVEPSVNQDVAFTEEQRRKLGLVGRLPSAVQTLDQQCRRAYRQLRAQPSNLGKNVYLEQLHDRNETVYFRLLVDNLSELLPIVYDPTVGEAIEQYSHEYRRPRGIYLSIDRPDDIKASFQTLGLGAEDVDLIVVTDAEEILGIGDWGVGGIAISVGKLTVYTAAAGIHPDRVIPVSLDVGTDNETLLNDPLYLGNRHARVRGRAYDRFIESYLKTASSLFPKALLHFEDFGPGNGRRILGEYGEKYRMFNDDLQGTGVITVAGVMAANKALDIDMAEHRVVVFGAGTAGVGIADQLRDCMIRAGAKPDQATGQIWLVDRAGLITDAMRDLRDYQRPYARPAREVARWSTNGPISLLDTVRHAKPTILIGTSTSHGAFTKDVVEAMAAATPRPIIFPLSNPTSRIEAMPADILAWTNGRALVCTGIPVPPVSLDDTTYHIGQANNALVYPGLGLGTIVSRASRVTPNMLFAAAEAVAGQVDPTGPGASLLPDVENLRASSATVALAVVGAAIEDGVAKAKPDNVIQAVQDAMWWPSYENGRR